MIKLLIFLFPVILNSQTKFRIPNSFQQNGKTIHVQFNQQHCDSLNAYGTFDYAKKLITLNDSITYAKTINSTFFHELLHCIFEHAQYNNLSRNEKLISRLSLYLNEAFESMKYDSTKH